MRSIVWLMALALACSGSEEASNDTTESNTGGDAPVADAPVSHDTPFGLMNGAHIADALYTAGQPSGASIEAAYAAGVRTVVSLRAQDEPGQEEELAAIERLGMRFERLPVAGPAGVTADNARELETLLVEASNHGATLVHCGSGNRAGSLIALRAFFEMNSTLDEALEEGRAAGLVSLEGRVREILEQVCVDSPDDVRCPNESTP